MIDPGQPFESFGIYRPIDGHLNEEIRAVAQAALPELQACVASAGLQGELIVQGALGGTFLNGRSISVNREWLRENGFDRARFETRLAQEVRPREVRLTVPLSHTSWMDPMLECWHSDLTRQQMLMGRW